MKFEKRKLMITPVSFSQAMELQDALLEAAKEQKISITADMAKSASSEGSEQDFGDIVRLFMTVASNKRLRENLFTCAERALYENHKVDEDFFESTEHRSLYYPIMIEIIRVNVGPLAENLFSMFLEIGETLTGKNQKPE